MDISVTKLDSGLTAILAHSPHVSSVTVRFGVRAGWKYETALPMGGVAHFLEHMAFKGTKRRPRAIDITKEIERRGGTTNASTSSEKTEYHIMFPCEYVDRGLDILSDIMLHSTLVQEEMTRESGAIIQELNGILDDAGSRIGLIDWPSLLYGDQPAGRSAIGTVEGLQAMKRSQLIQFMRDLYVTNNSVVCVSGNIKNKKKILKNIETHFADLPRGEPRFVKPPVDVAQSEPRFMSVQKPHDTQMHVMVGVRSPDMFHPSRYTLAVLATILGGNMSSRLYEEVRERRGLCYYIGTGTSVQTDVGSLHTLAGIAPDKASLVSNLILEQYKRIAQERVPEDELQGAIEYVTAHLRMSQDSMGAVGSNLCASWLLRNEIVPIEEKIARFRAVTSEQVLSLAQELFVNESLNMVAIGPNPNMEDELRPLLTF